ncbi:hypothetical protein AK88_05035 [Plasmodium fragile]|uniref:Uncharacterized protein n=1 Tax=Plasmodium fragile TaxID=5857 RepID=A0A0D9QHY6_PLAFR|nr:uncharacterized protein AK88_05035 [Plasmodium fragile]KJP85331.1 hypothetical protein AK88_05035 [Plasmodium fragile]
MQSINSISNTEQLLHFFDSLIADGYIITILGIKHVLKLSSELCQKFILYYFNQRKDQLRPTYLVQGFNNSKTKYTCSIFHQQDAMKMLRDGNYSVNIYSVQSNKTMANLSALWKQELQEIRRTYQKDVRGQPIIPQFSTMLLRDVKTKINAYSANSCYQFPHIMYMAEENVAATEAEKNINRLPSIGHASTYEKKNANRGKICTKLRGGFYECIDTYFRKKTPQEEKVNPFQPKGGNASKALATQGMGEMMDSNYVHNVARHNYGTKMDSNNFRKNVTGMNYGQNVHRLNFQPSLNQSNFENEVNHYNLINKVNHSNFENDVKHYNLINKVNHSNFENKVNHNNFENKVNHSNFENNVNHSNFENQVNHYNLRSKVNHTNLDNNENDTNFENNNWKSFMSRMIQSTNARIAENNMRDKKNYGRKRKPNSHAFVTNFRQDYPVGNIIYRNQNKFNMGHIPKAGTVVVTMNNARKEHEALVMPSRASTGRRENDVLREIFEYDERQIKLEGSNSNLNSGMLDYNSSLWEDESTEKDFASKIVCTEQEAQEVIKAVNWQEDGVDMFFENGYFVVVDKSISKRNEALEWYEGENKENANENYPFENKNKKESQQTLLT